MPKLVLARGTITNTDELIIVLSEPDNEPAAVLIHSDNEPAAVLIHSDNEPAAVLIHWPAAASVASPTAFPTVASKITAIVASAAVRLTQHKAQRL
jgi:hypothetical protein